MHRGSWHWLVDGHLVHLLCGAEAGGQGLYSIPLAEVQFWHLGRGVLSDRRHKARALHPGRVALWMRRAGLVHAAVVGGNITIGVILGGSFVVTRCIW